MKQKSEYRNLVDSRESRVISRRLPAVDFDYKAPFTLKMEILNPALYNFIHSFLKIVLLIGCIMPDSLLLEIGVEEIPHEIITDTLQQLKEKAISAFERAGIENSGINVYGTPRRLALILTGVLPGTKEKSVEKKGPPVKASFDNDGKPTKALLGFLESNKAGIEDIVKKEISGSLYTFLTRKEGGLKTASILPAVLKDIILSLSFPKAMKWGSCDTRFVRPIRWITALYGKKIVPFSLDGIESKGSTFGHRLLSDGKSFAVEKPEDYTSALRDRFVIADPDERRSIIKGLVDNTAKGFGANPVLSEGLLDTLVQLTEYPLIAAGTFGEEFLKLPKEVLVSEMIDHQKYIPLENREGDLIAKFLIITNTRPNDIIVNGNERVIRARFSDGKFFFDEDRRISLEDYVPKLANVLFAKGLGTLADKTGRLQEITTLIAGMTGYSDHIKNALRTALLCKADLVTNMVYEFPELQGIIGYYYALNSMENIDTAISVREHYQPRYSGDMLPSLPEGILVSLADRFDNLFAMYSKGNFVSGSKDPFGLRRQTLGIIRILIDKKIFLDIGVLSAKLSPLYKGFLSITGEEFESKILGFLTSRIKTVLKEYGFSYDEIEAGISGDVADIYDSYLRLEAIHNARKSDNFINLAVAFKRVKNIIKGQKAGALKKGLLQDESEKGLHSMLEDSSGVFLDSLNKRDYTGCISILTAFRPSVDKFFDDVLVMDSNQDLRKNRIALLSLVDGLFMKIIDFEKIIVE